MMNSLIYIVHDENTMRHYPVLGNENSTPDSIWLSQKPLFTPGSVVTIKSLDGKNKKTFICEK